RRDDLVTGVQTCALPICAAGGGRVRSGWRGPSGVGGRRRAGGVRRWWSSRWEVMRDGVRAGGSQPARRGARPGGAREQSGGGQRSEERRVGEGGRYEGGW